MKFKTIILAALVQKCLDAHGQNCEKWESEIDAIVARLYGLPADGIAIVENSEI